MTTADYTELAGASPRIALFFTDPGMLAEIQAILGAKYSSLLLINDREKLREFPFPLVIIVDHIHEVAQLKESRPIEGTEVLLAVAPEQSEMISAAYEVGVTECLSYPFSPEEVIEKSEKYLENFRSR